MGVSTIDFVIVRFFLQLPWRWEIVVVGRKKIKIREYRSCSFSLGAVCVGECSQVAELVLRLSVSILQ